MKAILAHLLLSSFLGSGSSAQVASPAASPPDSLRAALEQILRETQGAAAAVAWASPEAEAGGWTMVVSLSASPAVTDSSRFRLASVSKTLTALGVLALAEEGGLTLETRVSDIAPSLPIKNPWADRYPVRVVDLLEHTAGFDNLAPGHFYDLADSPRGLSEIVHHLAPELVVRWAPGDRWSYSSAGYAAAGYVVESVVREPLEQWLDRRVMSRIGWRDGAMRYVPGTVPVEALDGFDPPAHRVLAFPAGDATASARDMLHLLRFFIGRGRVNGEQVLDSATVSRMERPSASRLARLGVTWGTGPGLYSVVRAGHRFWGHGGDMPGFHNEFFYSPDLGVGYAILTASVSKDTRSRIRDLLIGELVTPGDAVDATPVTIEGVPQGWYRIANPRNAVLAPLDGLLYSARVEVDGTSLVFKPLLGDAAVFEHVGGYQLRERGQPLPTHAFLPAEADRPPALIIDSFYLVPVSPLVALSWPILALLGVAGLMLGVPLFVLAAVRARRRRSRMMEMSVALLTLALAATVGSALNLDLLGAGSPTPAAVVFFAAPMAFGAALCLTSYQGLRVWGAFGRLERYATVLVVAAGWDLFVLLLLGGYIGLRLWN